MRQDDKMETRMRANVGELRRDRTRDLEEGIVGIRRKLLSVPENDRHYGYRMRISVGEVLEDIREMLRA